MEFFDLGERGGLRAFPKWTVVCAIGLFFAQYSAGLVETHSLSEDVTVVRNSALSAFSIEMVFIDFLVRLRFDRTSDTKAAPGSIACDRDRFGRRCCSSLSRSAIWFASTKFRPWDANSFSSLCA